ncbi:MAG: DUF2330 domain-containing protein [Nannocystaceae bacterium]|nr:DUF2330 domain-containing protein [Nannocystaceae bacterium]
MNLRLLRRSTTAAGASALSLAALVFTTTTLVPTRAEACGCLSPPDPVTLDTDNFAVNQQAEQIIFEVGEETVSAHVQIRYAGDPEQFAWIVPVPNVPQLEISHTIAFGIVDEGTAPVAYAGYESLCPVPEYACEYHPAPECELPGETGTSDTWNDDGLTGGAGDTDGADTGGGEPPGGVDVIDMQMVGDYETVTFSADDAALAVEWLQENGFIVNETMTPYMQPYIDGGMVFVAAKLVAGAGVDSIKPLKITYAGTQPMIPLQLTAVAAEPHMTVSAFIYADESYAPLGHPLVQLDAGRIASDPAGRNNYPMVLAASIDEAGGDAFVREYEGAPVRPGFSDESGCCGSDDWCGIADDAQCQCPTSDWDAGDCESIDGLLESIELTNRLAEEYSVLTRLTTRLSPEEMTFDPMFEGVGVAQDAQGPLRLQGLEYSLLSCDTDVIGQNAYADNLRQQECTAMYCGEGSCVVGTSGKAGCDCNEGFVAKSFTDYDGAKSVTCVPEVGTVDLGLTTDLPDVCDGYDCGPGDCVALGGFPTCDCGTGDSAVIDDTLGAVTCEGDTQAIGDAGARNYTGPLQDLEVCAPPPPTCGDSGWLIDADRDGIHGVMCVSSTPAAERFEIPDPPTCEEVYGETATAVDDDDQAGSGGGCSSTGSAGGIGSGLLSLLLFGTFRLRRRRG